jgi:exopolyphosphatase/guanosine-5'-triphosphate,3'-diphosphate pyrophosphatase
VRRLAAIDIGTNTILMLVADTDKDGRIIPLEDLERTTRLGRGLSETGSIHPESLKKSLEVIDNYLTMCRNMEVDRVFMVGTSALREAKNAEVLLQYVQRHYGLTIQIISGEKEARLSYLTVEKEMGRGSPLLVLDIGGGSTEIIMGCAGRISELTSLNIGAVHLTERFLRTDPVTEEEFQQMLECIRRGLGAVAIKSPDGVVGLGGTITTLASVQMGKARFDMSRLHGSSLPRREVRRQVLLYKGTTHQQRLQIPGLPRDRADVILAGAAILQVAMNLLGCEHLIVSCHGLRYGLLYARASGRCIEKCSKSC